MSLPLNPGRVIVFDFHGSPPDEPGIMDGTHELLELIEENDPDT